MSRDPIDRIAQWAANEEYNLIRRVADSPQHQFDSPIERIFFAALFAASERTPPALRPLIVDQGRFLNPGEFASIRLVCPQFVVAGHRVDFAIRSCTWEGKWSEKIVFVECDGHDFHERTKEQAAKDRQQDRATQAAGHIILRFTGSELYRDPISCAADALKFLMNHFFGEDES